jgi:long-chain fatty acid transport protein
MRIRKIAASLFTLGMAAAPFAHATNGMNMEGYGPVASSMGGASMAYDNGTAAVMNNPATLGLMKEGNRADIAVGVLAPDITAKCDSSPCNGSPAAGQSAKSEATAFYMPAMGYVQKSGQLTYGAAVFSQGGMGTKYAADSFLTAGSNEMVRSEVGVGRFILPLAYQMDDKVTLGGSLDFVWASMDLKMALPGASFVDMAMGTQTYGSAGGSLLGSFAPAIPNGACVAGGGTATTSCINWARVDFSNTSQWSGQAKGNGLAFKLGGTYKVDSQLTLGATYHSKTSISDMTTTGATMSMNLADNTGASGTTVLPGSVSVHNFQWPQTIAFGAAYQATDKLLLVADYKNIGWKDVMKNFSMTFTVNGDVPGLGGQSVDMILNQNWDDQNVFQIGGAYKTTPEVTLRAGVNIANNPVPDAYMNPLFPAIAKNHLTLGAGYAVSNASNVDFAYVYVPKVSATNDQGVTVDFGGYSAQLMFSQLF